MNLSSLETRCTACGQVHPISAGQFPPGVLDLLQWDDGLIWTRELCDYLDRNDLEPSDYPGAHRDLIQANLTEHSVLVVGSLSPWIESISMGVRTVTTDIRPIRIDSDRIKSLPPDAAYAQKYDLVINYSGLEHFGLGRYGDPVDHDADKKWMRMIRDCIAPGGRLLLAVPLAMVGKTVGCWHRLYGPMELEKLTAGWKMKFVNDIRRPFLCPQGRQDWQNQPLLELTPI